MFERVRGAVQINLYNAKSVKESIYLGTKVNNLTTRLKKCM